MSVVASNRKSVLDRGLEDFKRGGQYHYEANIPDHIANREISKLAKAENHQDFNLFLKVSTIAGFGGAFLYSSATDLKLIPALAIATAGTATISTFFSALGNLGTEKTEGFFVDYKLPKSVLPIAFCAATFGSLAGDYVEQYMSSETTRQNIVTLESPQPRLQPTGFLTGGSF